MAHAVTFDTLEIDTGPVAPGDSVAAVLLGSGAAGAGLGLPLRARGSRRWLRDQRRNNVTTEVAERRRRLNGTPSRTLTRIRINLEAHARRQAVAVWE